MSPETKSKLKFTPEAAELCDRLIITQLKQLKLNKHRDQYTKDLNDIIHDLDLLLQEKPIQVTANFIRDIIVLAIMNDEIWVNEANCRKGDMNGNNLFLTHSLNTIRCIARRKVQDHLDNEGRKDWKIDTAKGFPEWIPSGYENEE